MRRLALLALALAACADPVPSPAAAARIAPSLSEPTSVPALAPASVAPPAPASVAAPSKPLPVPPTPPAVAVLEGRYPVAAPLALVTRDATADEDHLVRGWLGESYLRSLDRFRASGNARDLEAFVGPGAFRDQLAGALRGTSGSLALDSARVARVLVKPWGQTAFLDVDLAVTDRGASVERERGTLRLVPAPQIGYRVLDAWSPARADWMGRSMKAEVGMLPKELGPALAWHLSTESWSAGSDVNTYIGPGPETPYKSARRAYLESFDRTAVSARRLVDVTARIERFDTFTALGDGIASVRVAGTIITTDAAGRERRTSFERAVRLLRQVFGTSASLVVIDEQLERGAWASGDDLRLAEIDRTFG